METEKKRNIIRNLTAKGQNTRHAIKFSSLQDKQSKIVDRNVEKLSHTQQLAT